MKFAAPAILLLTPAFAVPASSQLTLVDEPGANTLLVELDPGAFASDDSTTLTGSVTADLEVDPDTGEVSAIGLRDGRVDGTDMSFSEGFGSLGYDLVVRDFSAAVFTPDPLQPVSPSSGDFDASLHRFRVDQGTITGEALGQAVDESFSDEPVTGDGGGTANLSLTETGTSELHVTFDVVLTLPVAVNDSFDADGTPVNVTADGTIKAAGTIDVPKSDYLAWTIAGGIDGADAGADANGDGIPNALAWAAGFEVDADARAVMPRANADGSFTFEVPETRGDIILLASDDLATWEPVLFERISTLFNPLQPGTSGEVTVDPSGNPAEFLRLRVDP